MVEWVFRMLFYARLPYLLQIPINTRNLRMERVDIGWEPNLSLCLYKHLCGGGWIAHVGVIQVWIHPSDKR